MDSARPSERHVLHFDSLSDPSNSETYTCIIAMKEYPVRQHTEDTRAKARDANALLQFYPDSEITHFVEVDLPSDAIAMGQLTRDVVIDGVTVQVPVSLFISVPQEGRRADMARAKSSTELHPKLAARGVKAGPEIFQLIAERPELLHDIIDPHETASALLYQHPGLVNLSVAGGGTVPSFILRECISEALRRKSVLVQRIRAARADWCRYERLMDDGKPASDDDGKPLFTMTLDVRVRRALSDPVIEALKYSQQFEELKGQTWTVQYGTTTEADAETAAAARQPRELPPADRMRWERKSLSSEHGVSFEGLEYDEPRDGGVTFETFWSDEDPEVPLRPELVNDLLTGGAFLRVDTTERPDGAWRADIPSRLPRPEEPTRWRLPMGDRKEAVADLELGGLRTDLRIRVSLVPHLTPMHLSRVHFGVKRLGREELVWSQEAATGPRGELRVTMKNHRLRHLSAYAEFFDGRDRPIPVQPLAFLPGTIRRDFDSHPTRRYVDVIGPVDAVFGVPIGADPTELTIPFPEGATKMRLYYGGLGTGKYDEIACPAGIACTSVMELAVPVLLLLAGAAEYRTSFIANLLKDRMVRFGVFSVGATLLGSGLYIGLAQDPGRAGIKVALKLGPMLGKMGLQWGLKRLLTYLSRKYGEGLVRRGIPFVNAGFMAFDAAVTFAQLGQTTAAILQSPWVYRYEITRTFDLQVRLLPDGRFPIHHDLLRVQVVYDSGAELRHADLTFPPDPIEDPIELRFNNIPAGGHLQVFAFFYAANGWQSGKGSSDWIDARGADDGTPSREVELLIKNELIPLDDKSVYSHRLSTEVRDNRHRWKSGPPPTATKATNPPDEKHRILAWNGITVAERPSMMGYAWQATGLRLPRDRSGPITDDALYVVQNIGSGSDPSSRHAIPPVGFSGQSGITYDLHSAGDGSGNSFFLDPTGGDFSEDHLEGGYHLRRVALASQQTPAFRPGSGASWGRFPRPMDSIVIHPQGYAAGITAEADKIYLLQLPAEAVGDKDAPMASLASGGGARDGLLSRPRAIAVALDGRLLVLEDGNRRIQSFDFTGNPVAYFGGGKSAVLPLRDTGATSTYLDLSVEAKGYLFVLAHDGDGARPSQYRVDIYQPDGTFLVSTPGVSAAKIAVDLARAMYTLNWETLRGVDGRTEPSVSMWVPPPPDPEGELG